MNGLYGSGKPKITKCNVWRKWRDDSDKDKRKAFKKDTGPKDSFDPELFLKDPEDVANCVAILRANFDLIKLAYIEMLAQSPRSYPEVSAEAFMNAITKKQSEQDKAALPRSRIELTFIRTTRGDDGKGMNGTLCRGELFEILLRMT